jgi:PAS domain S-box-containing protein
MVPAKLKDLVRGIGKRGSSAVTFEHLPERKQPEADLQAGHQELSALYALLAPISQAEELTKVLDDAVTKIMEITGADAASLRLLDEEGKRFKLASYRGFSEEYKREMPMVRKEGGITGKVIDTGEPFLSANVLEDPRVTRGLLPRDGFKSAAFLPLKTPEKTFGIMTLASRQPGQLSLKKEELLIAVAHQISVTLENTRLLEETQRKNQELEGLYTISSATTQSLDVQATVHSALLKTIEVLRVDAGRLYIFDKSRNELRLTAHHGLAPEILKDYEHYAPGEGIVGNIFKECQPIVISDVNTDPGYASMARSKVAIKWGFRSLIGLPITIKGQPIGVIYLFGRLVREFAPQELQLLAAIGGQIGVAFENARLYEETERREKIQQLLKELSQDITSLGDESLCRKLTQRVREFFRVDVSDVRVFDAKGWHLRGISGIDPRQIPKAWGASNSARKRSLWIRENRRPLMIPDITKGSMEPSGMVLESAGIRGYLGVPIISHQGEVTGVLRVMTYQPREFSEGEVDLLQQLANGTAIALDNARLYHESQKQQKIQRLLKDLSQDITALDLDSLLRKLTEKIREFFKVDVADLKIVEQGVSKAIGISGTNAEHFLTHRKGNLRGRSRWILENRKPLVIKDTSQETDGPADSNTRKIGIRGYLAVPLFSRGGEVVGILRALTYQPREFAQEEIDLLQQLANGAALSLENAKLFHETELRAKEQAVLNAISMATSQSLELEELLQTALDKVLEVTERERGYIRLKNPVSGEITLAAHRGISEEYAKVLLYRRTPGGKSDRVFHSGEPLVINDTKGSVLKEEARKEGSSSIAWIPLNAQGRVVGILNVSTSRPIPFEDRDVELLQAIGNVIGVAIENARLFEETKRRAQEQAALNSIAMATSGLVNMEELLATALDKVMEVMNRDCGYIQLKDPITGKVTFPAHKGISEEYIEDLLHRRIPRGYSDQVFESGELLIINDLDGKTLRSETLRQGLRSVAWIPLKARGRVLGIMNLSTTGLTSFTPREEELLKALSSVIGVALENAGLFGNIRRHAEDLRRTRDHLENIFNSLDREMFWSSDPRSDTLLYVSQGTENIYGISREAFSKSPAFWKQVVHPEDAPIVEAIEQEIQAGKTVKQEYRIIRPKTAEVRWVLTRIIPVLDQEGKVTRIDGLLIDVTESKQAEEALARKAEELTRSNTELQHFAYIASHDLQEPLRMVAGYTQLLARRYKEKLEPDAKEFIDFAVDGVTRMQALINALLAYSRIGTKGKEFEPTDLKAALDYALNNLRAAIQESGTVVTHDPLPTVMGDSTQLGQLLQNLIGNAIKFRGEEAPRIHLSCQQNDREWLLSVRDNGIGIDPQYVERIFVIFQRLHNKQEYPGTGIGLALCKKIVERHGGRIWVESQPGEGATFYFTMPT